MLAAIGVFVSAMAVGSIAVVSIEAAAGRASSRESLILFRACPSVLLDTTACEDMVAQSVCSTKCGFT